MPQNDHHDAEPFPELELGEASTDPYQSRRRTTSRGSSVANMVRRLSRDYSDSRPPESFASVTSDIFSTIAAERPRPTRPQSARMGSEKSAGGVVATPVASSDEATIAAPAEPRNDATAPFDNGYHFPPKYSTWESTKMGLASFWKFFITPMGFFWTIYGLNVVAWGGMLFLLLCNAAPAMCYPSCDDIDSPRRKWVEWDSQILTALFCVPAFGLAPWRFRDLWYLMKYRIKGDHLALRRLAGIHSGWFRLKGSQDLPVDVGPDNIPDGVPQDCIPYPEKNMAPPPPTGTRAPPTATWKLDFAIQTMVWNTFAQCGLCGIMWGMNRYDRPSWTTGFLVAVACLIAIAGGLLMFFEGKKVKRIEGVPLTERDQEKLAQDKELGIPHYNNLKDKKPKQRKGDPEK